MESETWQVYGFKGGKGKRPKSMGKLYFGETLNKDRALKAAQNIFCFSVVTDVAASKYTRWDLIIEGAKGLKWLWIPAILVITGFILFFHIGLPAMIMVIGGISYGIAYAPHSPV